MLPTVRSAGVCTAGSGLVRSSMQRTGMPASMTAWMFALGPSDRYESAQQASVRTSGSVSKMSELSTGRAGRTISKSGAGLPRQKFERVQVALRFMVSLQSGVICWRRAGRAPHWRTRSRQELESPAMLPSAHTACSRTSTSGELRRLTKTGIAFAEMTTWVCSLVPEAMLVRAQAASNWSLVFSSRLRNSTKRGTTPTAITSEMGGLRSMDRSLRKFLVCSSWTTGLSELMPMR
mmetsp:Transcript_25248/g.71355  ORF Transcript_25248/g.71355 Transcript_25248/m.71355 type:complete len:235 (-) Transcript_25248:259-963(-)